MNKENCALKLIDVINLIGSYRSFSNCQSTTRNIPEERICRHTALLRRIKAPKQRNIKIKISSTNCNLHSIPTWYSCTYRCFCKHGLRTHKFQYEMLQTNVSMCGLLSMEAGGRGDGGRPSNCLLHGGATVWNWASCYPDGALKFWGGFWVFFLKTFTPLAPKNKSHQNKIQLLSRL